MKANAKIEREKYGPSLVEVTLGAALSLGLGVALAAVYLLMKPVQTVRELPKEEDRPAGQVYYVEGSKDGTKGRTWMRKRQLLLEGQTAEIPLVEDELNAWVAEGAKPAAEGPPALIAPASVNFRIRGGDFQVGVPSTVNLVGYSQPVIFQIRGGFERDGDRFVFEPREFYAGSLAVGRLPFLQGFILNRLVAAKPPPEDVVGAWSRLSNVVVEGDTLRLSLPD